MYICKYALRLPILAFSVRQHSAGINFSDFYLSFGASGIIIINFRSTYLSYDSHLRLERTFVEEITLGESVALEF